MSARVGTSALAAGLGCAQLVAWAALYYSIAVLAEPMRVELGTSPSLVFGCFSGALFVSGLLAPWAGKAVDRLGGRAVLIASTLVGAAGFGILARSSSLAGLAIGWAVAGVAMALGLYDACFAAIGQLERAGYRAVVTRVTLIAGFASTASWPLSHYLLRSSSWRDVCDLYALGLLSCAPIYFAVLPAAPPARAPSASVTTIDAPAITASVRRRARMLSWSFAGAALIGSAVSAHIVGVLTAFRLPADRVVWIASSIGVLQVLGRVIDLRLGYKRSASQLGFITFAALAAAMALLVATPAAPPLVFGFALLYGLANGLVTIAKATLPIELLGFESVGTVLGAFSAPSLVARAVAPLCFATAMSTAGVRAALLGSLAAGLASFAAYSWSMRTP